ncbi:MAG TPA: T6SS immunity protein Tdi1 domain-containing protein [Thermoanaerobaculia bacterium]|nr:T6SS immunity protein Tdi1 domain-containing protein [Thermoanaerobaculia bacterium]
MNFDELLAPVVGEPHIDDALASWEWLVPRGVKPLLATPFGDLFVVENSAAVSFLDIIAGTFERVAESVSAWEQLLRDQNFLDRHFMPGFVSQLRESGMVLAQGECYVPKLEPILGGAWETQNWSADHPENYDGDNDGNNYPYAFAAGSRLGIVCALSDVHRVDKFATGGACPFPTAKGYEAARFTGDVILIGLLKEAVAVRAVKVR